MSLSAMSAGSILRSPSFAPVNTDMFTVMGPSPGKDNVSFSFTFLISLTLFPSAVYITMIAYCKCSHFMWLLALSSLGKGKERMYLSVVSKVILCLNTKTSWGPFFPFVHSACYGDAMVILYLPRSAAFQATLRFPVGIGEVFTCFTLAANCFSPSPFDSHQTLSCSKRFDVRVGALIILWIVYVFMYSPSVNGFCVLLSHELPEN